MVVCVGSIIHFIVYSYLYFLQLKYLVLGGTLPCTSDVAVKIASYVLQGLLVLITDVLVMFVISSGVRRF